MGGFLLPVRGVFVAYGRPEGIGDEEILKNLLALNLGRSARTCLGE